MESIINHVTDFWTFLTLSPFLANIFWSTMWIFKIPLFCIYLEMYRPGQPNRDETTYLHNITTENADMYVVSSRLDCPGLYNDDNLFGFYHKFNSFMKFKKKSKSYLVIFLEGQIFKIYDFFRNQKNSGNLWA